VLKYDGYFLGYFLVITLATVSFPRHIRPAFRPALYLLSPSVSPPGAPSICISYCFYYCFSYCFVFIALRRPSGGVDFTDTEESGSKRRTVVYITPFLSLSFQIINQINTHEPSVNTRPLASRLPNILTDLCLRFARNPTLFNTAELSLASIRSYLALLRF
jgi:hypothetical protein